MDDPTKMTREEFKLQYEYARRCYCESCTKRRVLHFFLEKAVCFECCQILEQDK